MHAIKKAAKETHAAKLRSYGAKHSGKAFSDTGPYDGVPQLDVTPKAVQAQKVPTRKHGGHVDGKKINQRLDRAQRANGGRTKSKGKTNVTVVVAPQQASPGAAAMPQRVPVPVPAGGPDPAVSPMGGPPVIPPGLGSLPGALGTGPLPGRKHGGRVREEFRRNDA